MPLSEIAYLWMIIHYNAMLNISLSFCFSFGSLKMEEAKDIHTRLRKAAGLINFVKDTLVPQLAEKSQDGSDLDIRVIGAYLNQCTAEAQEVTIAR